MFIYIIYEFVIIKNMLLATLLFYLSSFNSLVFIKFFKILKYFSVRDYKEHVASNIKSFVNYLK